MATMGVSVARRAALRKLRGGGRSDHGVLGEDAVQGVMQMVVTNLLMGIMDCMIPISVILMDLASSSSTFPELSPSPLTIRLQEPAAVPLVPRLTLSDHPRALSFCI